MATTAAVTFMLETAGSRIIVYQAEELPISCPVVRDFYHHSDQG